MKFFQILNRIQVWLTFELLSSYDLDLDAPLQHTGTYLGTGYRTQILLSWIEDWKIRENSY